MIAGKIPGRPLFAVLLLQLICSVCVANDFQAGNQYIFNTEYDINYLYDWNASSGYYQENNKNTFVWTAPDVETPTEVTIAVFVTDKTCGCHSNADKVITVLPLEVIKQMPDLGNNDTETYSSIPETSPEQNMTSNAEEINLTDLSQPESDIDANRYNELIEMPTATETPPQVDPSDPPAKTALDQAEKSENLSEVDYSSDESTNPSGQAEAKTELASELPIEQDSTDASEIIPLTFDDGTKVDVEFIESDTGTYTAITVSEDGGVPSTTRDNGLEISIQHDINITQPSAPAINQTPEEGDQPRDKTVMLAVADETRSTVASPEQSNPEDGRDDAALASLEQEPSTSEPMGDRSAVAAISADQSAADGLENSTQQDSNITQPS